MLTRTKTSLHRNIGPSLFFIHGVMEYIGCQFNQERSIKIIILGELKILPRQPHDRVNVAPKREHLEMCNVAIDAVQTEGAAVSRY